MGSNDDDMFADAPATTSKRGGLFEALTAPAAAEKTGPQSRKREADCESGLQADAKKPREGSSTAQDTAAGQAWTAIQAAYSEDKGSRTAMEDVAVLKVDARESQQTGTRMSFFGVFDGHGGRQVAQYAADNLHSTVMAAGLAAEVDKSNSGGGGTAAATAPAAAVSAKACRAAITAGFKQLDEAVLNKCAAEGWSDGATAVAVWVVGELALIANVGDAKCVLARRPQGGAGGAQQASALDPQPGPRQEQRQQQGGAAMAAQASGKAAQPAVQPEQYKAVTLTREHRAIYPQERQRIERAGGFVSADGRLGGRVEVSRALGDRAFKKQGMSAVPDIQAFQLSPREAFLILGCDGFWGVFDPQDAVDFAAREMAKGYDVKQTCNRLIYEAIRERHCKDNVTVMLIKLVV